MEERPAKTSLWDKISRKKNSPETDAEFRELLQEVKDNGVLDTDTFNLISNALTFQTLEVRDVMVTYSRMHVIHERDSLKKIIAFTNQTSHSRFPVTTDDKDEIIGILHVKDLLRYHFNQEQFDLKSIVREVVYVPESKPLSTLIKEFREKRNHLAIVVDEHGGVCGLITLEDAIEEIFGDIDDEFDRAEDPHHIVQLGEETYRINALTEIEEFNGYFATSLSAEEVDTVGGFVISLFGYIPKRGETISSRGFVFKVDKVDSRRILYLKVTRKTAPAHHGHKP